MILKGLLFFLLLVLGGFSAVVLMIPSVMLVLVHSKRVIGWRRRYVSYISGIYFDYSAALIQLLGGTKIHIYSNTPTDILLNDKSALIICNHRSLVDWMFAGWCYASIFNLNSSLRVILKDSLRSVPLFGWAMQIMMYIFLSRKREIDVPHIKRMFSYLLCTGATPSLLLFPEGTDLSESNKKKSNAYAQNKNLPPLEYVLYPKPTGLLCCLITLNEKQESANLHKSKIINKNSNTAILDSTDSDEKRGNEKIAASIINNGNEIHSRNNGNSTIYGNSVNIGNNKKEHKAESIMSVQEEIPYVRGNESKDGNNTRLKSKEIEFNREFEIRKERGENGNRRSSSYNDVNKIENNVNQQINPENMKYDTKLRNEDYKVEQKLIENVKKNENENEIENDREKDNEKKEFNKVNTIHALHDLTIAYTDFKHGKRTSDKSILFGEFPPEVHILVDRFLIEDIPLEKVAFEQWLRASFYRKEKLLKSFYESDMKDIVNNVNIKNEGKMDFLTDSYQVRNWPNKLHVKVDRNRPILVVNIWIIGVFSCLYYFIWYRWFVVVMITSCIAVRAFNGFDSVELALHGDMILRELFCNNNENNDNTNTISTNDSSSSNYVNNATVGIEKNDNIDKYDNLMVKNTIKEKEKDKDKDKSI